MPLAPQWRTRIIAGLAATAAVIGAIYASTGSPELAALFMVGAGLVTLAVIQPIPIDTLAVGLAMTGYIVGNRGFAQISLVGNSPLLPAESTLMIGITALVFRCAFNREAPFKKDLLNFLVALWIALGSIRVLFDLKTYGFMAVRDYALVYYALFFFVAQHLARSAASFRFLKGCLYIACVILLLIQPFYYWFDDFFFRVLLIRGTPLIYYKGDLLTTFLSVTSVLFFLRFESTKRIRSLLISVGALIPVMASDNRASLLGLWVATALLAYGRRWRFAALQFVGGAILAIIILLAAAVQGKSWESTVVFKFYERVISVADFSGQQSYRGAETFNKGDNNAFRSIWWRATVEETIEVNPWVGLGFGHDLANRFLEKYYPTGNEDFSARSPHNILITIFARMGLVGLLSFLAIIGALMLAALKAVRRPREDIDTPSLWCTVWIIFTSACFGVVLEGPMGAVIFWTVLGLAHHRLTSSQPEEEPSQPAQLEIDTPESQRGPGSASIRSIN